VVGALFIAFGIVQYFNGAGFGGLWTAFIGWFLLQAAGESHRATGIKHSIDGVSVAEVMTRDCPTVDSHQNIRDFVDQVLLRTGQRCFVVTENGTIAGLVTPHEIKEVSQNRWPYTTLDDVMRPLDSMHTVTPDTSLTNALEVMRKEDLNQLPVVSKGHLEGVLSRADILSFLQLRAELQA
jgi:CBS domain-containing protein